MKNPYKENLFKLNVFDRKDNDLSENNVIFEYSSNSNNVNTDSDRDREINLLNELDKIKDFVPMGQIS